MMEPKIIKRTTIWTVLGIAVSGCTFWLFFLSPFGLIIWVAILIYLIVKKSQLKWYIVLSAWLLVPACSFVKGSINYFGGTATIKSIGGPRLYHGIDIETRAPRVSSGCIFIGFEPFIFTGNNTAVKFWTWTLGFQQGSYRGVLPSEQEVKEIMLTAKSTKVAREGARFKILSPTDSIVFDTLEFYKFSYKGLDSAAMKTLNNECALVKPLDSNDEETPIYLLDIANSKILTSYY